MTLVHVVAGRNLKYVTAYNQLKFPSCPSQTGQASQSSEGFHTSSGWPGPSIIEGKYGPEIPEKGKRGQNFAREGTKTGLPKRGVQ